MAQVTLTVTAQQVQVGQWLIAKPDVQAQLIANGYPGTLQGLAQAVFDDGYKQLMNKMQGRRADERLQKLEAYAELAAQVDAKPDPGNGTGVF